MPKQKIEKTQEPNEISRLCELIQSEKSKMSERTRHLYVEVLGCLGDALTGAGIIAYGVTTGFNASYRPGGRLESEKELRRILGSSATHLREEGAEVLGYTH